MADQEQHLILTAMAVALPLMVAGYYGFKHWQPKLLTRVLLGAAMLGTGAALMYPLIYGPGDLLQSPIRFGISAALVGLGINQATAPLRVAAGRAA